MLEGGIVSGAYSDIYNLFCRQHHCEGRYCVDCVAINADKHSYFIPLVLLTGSVYQNGRLSDHPLVYPTM